MGNNNSQAGFWNDQVWKAIGDGVIKAIRAIRVAQRVFPEPKSGHTWLSRLSATDASRLPISSLLDGLMPVKDTPSVTCSSSV